MHFYIENPDPPLHLTAYNAGSMSFNINWMSSFDGNKNHLRFVLRITSQDTSEVTNVNKTVAANSHPLNTSYSQLIDSNENILPFTNYTVTIRGCNEIGCSEPSGRSNKIETLQYCKFLIIYRNFKNIMKHFFSFNFIKILFCIAVKSYR